MKVLHVIPSLSPVHGGPTKALLLMEQALASRGIQVETATTNDDGAGKINGRPCGTAMMEDGIVRHYFRKRMDFYTTAPGFASWIAGAARGYDLVHIHALFSFTSAVAARAAKRAAIPYVVRPLGTLDRYSLSHRRPALKQLSMMVIERPLLRHAAAVHFTSVAEAQQARDLRIPWREAIIPLAVENPPAGHAARSNREAGGAVRLLFLSRLDPKKNVEGLLEAYALLLPAHPGMRLTIAGDGAPAYVEALRARARALGVDSQVHWPGQVAGVAKEELLARADLFVLPSFSENFGIAAAEALAHGLPCVLGTGVAISDEVERAGAGIAVAPDAKSIASALAQLLADGGARARMAANAARLARERYSIEAMGAALEQLYRDIVSA
jgi:glycosyltransferase involved in cell wall biosynthesis